MDQDVKRTPEAKNGATSTLLGEAIARHNAQKSEAAGRQVELFDQGDRLPDDDAAGSVPAGDKPAGPGRPPGAGNKATEAFRRFVRARYGDPFLKIMDRAMADPKGLAELLGAPSAWDVTQKQMEWLLRLMPYMHSAMPAEVKIQSKGALAVAIGVVPGLPSGDRNVAADPIKALLAYAEENQGLMTLPGTELHVSQLHADAKRPDDAEG